MKDKVAEIHTERLDALVYELTTLATEDILPSIRHVKHDLFNLTDESQVFLAKIGKKPTKGKDAMLWLHYGREKVQDALGYLQQLSDELDDIEDEINRDEVNNAK